MKTFTQLRNLYGSLAGTSNATALTLGDQLINDGHRITCGARDWPFLYKTDATMVTTASTQFKEMPNDVGRLISVTVANGSNNITPREAPSQDFWNQLNYTSYTSDYAEWYFVRNGQLGLWPTPATSSNIITLYYKRLVKDLSIADVTSSTVTSIANGGTAMVISAGGAVSWAGRFIRITESDTANKGDGFWYEISAATATTITLLKPYQGTTIAAGAAACTVGQMPLLPEAYHEMPVWYALGEYWDLQGELNRATQYRNKHAILQKQLVGEYSTRTSDVVIRDSNEPTSQLDPNLFIRY